MQNRIVWSFGEPPQNLYRHRIYYVNDSKDYRAVKKGASFTVEVPNTSSVEIPFAVRAMLAFRPCAAQQKGPQAYTVVDGIMLVLELLPYVPPHKVSMNVSTFMSFTLDPKDGRLVVPYSTGEKARTFFRVAVTVCGPISPQPAKVSVRGMLLDPHTRESALALRAVSWAHYEGATRGLDDRIRDHHTGKFSAKRKRPRTDTDTHDDPKLAKHSKRQAHVHAQPLSQPLFPPFSMHTPYALCAWKR